MLPGKYWLWIAAIAVLLLAVAPANAASSGEPGVHIAKMVIEPSGPDFNVSVNYTTGFMTRIFSVLFGAKVVQPAIVDQVSVLGDVELIDIDTSAQTARLVAKDQGQMSGGMYLYDGNAEFQVPVDVLEIKGKAIDQPITKNNSASMPTFFYYP